MTFSNCSAERPIRAPALVAFVALGVLASSPAWCQQTVGLFRNETPQDGLTLFSPAVSTTTWLINNDGLTVHSWTSAYEPGAMAYLLDNGDLLRAARSAGGASSPDVEQFDWDGILLWQFEYGDFVTHHDMEPLPNGNVLLVARETLTEAEAIAEGKNPALFTGELWIDRVIEVQPTPPVGGIIVWEWHTRDHLIQDFDPTKGNYGPVEDHSERIDFNYPSSHDTTHINGIDYNAELDQIVLSAREMDEIWIIDHGTTTAEAAGSSGGRYGRGGDLLYRWGNPQVYRRGTPADRKLYGQHDSNWVAAGRPGAGNIMVFNNGDERPEGSYSTVEEIVPPVDANGFYPVLAPGEAFPPSAAVWSFAADPPQSLYSRGRSGATRQPNGNTLICESDKGRFVEVEPDLDVVWEYVSPVGDGGAVAQGGVPAHSGVFKIVRYPLDFPGLAGRDLTAGDPIEIFSPPFPVAETTLRAARTSPDGSTIDVAWDAFSCPSADYNLIVGELQSVASYAITDAACAIGPGGGYLWAGVPAADLFFLVVGTDLLGVYESSWGRDSLSAERNGTKASFFCGATTKVVSSTCIAAIP